MSRDFSWYKRNPKKFIRGVQGLGGPEYIGAYALIIDLIYEDQDSCPNDAAWIGGLLGCSARKARVLIDRLLELDKLQVNSEGRLTNRVAEKEIESRVEFHQKAVENGSKGGRKSRENCDAHNVNKRLVKATEDHLQDNTVHQKENSDVPSLFSPGALPTDEEPFILLPTNRFETKGEKVVIFPSEIAQLKILYPAVDVEQHMRNMLGWLMSNPSKRKTAGGMRAFMHKWLADKQNKAGGPVSAAPMARRNDGSLFATGKIVSLFPPKDEIQ